MVSQLDTNPTFIITVWYHRTEAYYTFGPFTFEEATKFEDSLRNNPTVSADSIVVLNDPQLFGTGQEMG